MFKSILLFGRLALLFLLMLMLVNSIYTIPSQPARPVLFKSVPASAPNNSQNNYIASDTQTNVEEALPVAKSTPPERIGDEYLALGDSVAYGVGAPLPSEQGYTGQFYNNYLKRVQPRLSSYKNFGVPGETSSSFLQSTRGLSQMQRALNELDAAKADNRRISPITLTIGGNDMLDARGLSSTDKDSALSKYDANLQRILDNLKAHASAESDVIVTTYFNPYGGPTASQDDVTWIQRFNALIKQRAQEHGFKTADFYTPILGNESSLTWANYNDVHPNNSGYARLARSVWQASGYDTIPPTLEMLYSNLPKDGRIENGQRFAFKLDVQDNWNIQTGAIAGAGTVWEATVKVDDAANQNLAPVPVRFIKGPPGSQQYSYVLDTSSLNVGSHVIHFTATDAAGNSQELNLTFEVID